MLLTVPFNYWLHLLVISESKFFFTIILFIFCPPVYGVLQTLNKQAKGD